MHITVENLPKSRLKLIVELSPEDMKPFLEKAAEALSKEHKIEGFRPGKASFGIVVQRVGAQHVWEAAAEIAVRKTYVQAIRDRQLPTVGQPQIQVQKLAPDNPFVYTAESAVLPSVTVGDLQKWKAKRDIPAVAPADVEKAVEDLREMFATEALVDRAAKTGDKVEVDIELTMNKVPIEGGSSKNHPIVIGTNRFIPGFEDQLVGTKRDERKTFTLPFPPEYHNAQLAGKHGEFTVTVNSIAQITKPEVNDDFAKKAGKFTSVGELRQHLEKNLHDEANERADNAFEQRLVDELISRSTFGDLPDLLIDSELDKMLHELQEQVTQRGGKWEDYLSSIKKSADDLKQEFRTPAERRVKAALLIRTIARQERIDAEPKQVEEEVQSTMKMYQGNPEVLKRIDSEDYRDYVRSLQVNRRVVELLKQRATTAA